MYCTYLHVFHVITYTDIMQGYNKDILITTLLELNLIKLKVKY